MKANSYRIGYTRIEVDYDWVEANSFEEAKKKWQEDASDDEELMFIEDVNGERIDY